MQRAGRQCVEMPRMFTGLSDSSEDFETCRIFPRRFVDSPVSGLLVAGHGCRDTAVRE
jgi:hypothetical protein